jgi:hypothetical protein
MNEVMKDVDSHDLDAWFERLRENMEHEDHGQEDPDFEAHK